MPEVTPEPSVPTMPTFEEPSMPEVTPKPSAPTMPTFEAPSMPEVTSEPSAPTMPTFEAPSMPEVTPESSAPTMPTFEVPSMPESSQNIQENNVSTPIYEVPIASSTDNIPVIDQPIEPSVNIGNTNVETFVAPTNNIPEQTANPTIKAAVPNMRIALNTIRECENTLEKYGFNVDVEEIDFEDSYQVIFKIEK